MINDANLQADVSKNILDVSVTHEPDTMDHFSLTIANPYPDMPWTHDKEKAKLFQEGNTVSIKMGYVGDLRVLFDGLITSVSPTFPSSWHANIEHQWLHSDAASARHVQDSHLPAKDRQGDRPANRRRPWV